jgi:hypothetical protein
MKAKGSGNPEPFAFIAEWMALSHPVSNFKIF